MTVTSIRPAGEQHLNSQLRRRLTRWGGTTAALFIATTPLSAKASTGERLPELTRPINSAEVIKGIKPENRELKTEIEGAKLAQNVNVELNIRLGSGAFRGSIYLNNNPYRIGRQHNGYPVILLTNGQEAIIFQNRTLLKYTVVTGRDFFNRPVYGTNERLLPPGAYYLVEGNVGERVPDSYFQSQQAPQTIPQQTQQEPVFSYSGKNGTYSYKVNRSQPTTNGTILHTGFINGDCSVGGNESFFIPDNPNSVIHRYDNSNGRITPLSGGELSGSARYGLTALQEAGRGNCASTFGYSLF